MLVLWLFVAVWGQYQGTSLESWRKQAQKKRAIWRARARKLLSKSEGQEPAQFQKFIYENF